MSDTFCQRLKKLREERGLTQGALAAEFSMSTSAIGMYERGQRKPDLEQLQEFAEFFDVTTDYLLGRSKNPTPKGRTMHVPDDFVILARKTGDLSEETRKRIYKIINSTVDNVLDFLEEEERKKSPDNE